MREFRRCGQKMAKLYKNVSHLRMQTDIKSKCMSYKIGYQRVNN